MITTTFTCDRCGHSQATAEQMWDVRVEYCLRSTHMTYGYRWSKAREAMWCQPCMEAMKLLGTGEKPPADEKPAPPPTIEDFIREICRDEISAAQQT